MPDTERDIVKTSVERQTEVGITSSLERTDEGVRRPLIKLCRRREELDEYRIRISLPVVSNCKVDEMGGCGSYGKFKARTRPRNLLCPCIDCHSAPIRWK